MLNRLLDVFASFQRHDVRYLVIGGIAAILHGVPRATFDLDILIEASPDNAQRLLDALTDAQLATATLITADELLAHEITIFRDRVRIDVQTYTPGIKFEDAWRRRVAMSYQDCEFYVATKDDVIASKRAAGRDQDLEDVKMLEINSETDEGER
jgi:hypothetical protein